MTENNTIPRVTLDRIHSTTGPLGQALRTVPGWIEALARWERASRFVPAIGAHTALGEVSDLVNEAIDDEDVDPESLIDQAASALQREAASSLLAKATYEVRQAAADALDATVAGHAGAIFKSLSGQLQELLDEAEPVFERLGDVATAEEAIAAGVVDEWQQVSDLERHYAAIRTAGGRYWARVDTRGRSMRDTVISYIKTPEAVDPNFVEHRSKKVPTGLKRRGDSAARSWPEFWEGAALRWCVDHRETEPWVPSPDELDSREGELLEEARRRYLESEGESVVPARPIRGTRGVA